MKKIIFLSITALIFGTALHAQTADTASTAKTHKAWHNKGNQNGDADFYKKLNLTDDQKSKLKTISDDQKSQIATIKGNTSLSEDQKKAQIKAAKTDAYNKRQAVYTPEQKAVIKEDHGKKHHHGKKDGNTTASND